MSEKKQSSVEWLERELKKIPFIDPKKAFEQAKTMHEKEIKKAWDHGFSFTSVYQSAKEYYNETFGE